MYFSCKSLFRENMYDCMYKLSLRRQGKIILTAIIFQLLHLLAEWRQFWFLILKKKNLANQMKHRFICFVRVRIHIPCVLFHCVGCIFLFDYCFLGNLLQKKRRIIYLWIFYYFCNIQCIRCKIEIFILCNWNWYGIFSISNNLSLLNLLYVRNKKMTAEFNGIFYIWR